MADVPADTPSAPSGGVRALTADAGLALSRPTKSRPYWPPRTPRWILRCFDAANANVPVEGGIYHVNQVRDDALGATALPIVTVLDAPGQSYGARREPGKSVLQSKPAESVIETSSAVFEQTFRRRTVCGQRDPANSDSHTAD